MSRFILKVSNRNRGLLLISRRICFIFLTPSLNMGMLFFLFDLESMDTVVFVHGYNPVHSHAISTQNPFLIPKCYHLSPPLILFLDASWHPPLGFISARRRMIGVPPITVRTFPIFHDQRLPPVPQFSPQNPLIEGADNR